MDDVFKKGLERIWEEYAESMHDKPIKEVQSPVNFVHYLLQKRSPLSRWLKWAIIARAVADIILAVAIISWIWTSKNG